MDLLILKVDVLNIDHTYQRQPDPARVKRIADNWDDRLVNTLVVNQREDGSFWVIEGQHRALAAKLRHDKNFELVCETHYGLTPKQEAEIFVGIHEERRNPSSYAKFHGRLAAGEAAIVSIEDMLANLGLKTGRHARDGVVGSVAALQAVEREHGLANLERALRMMRDCFGMKKPTWDADMIRALGLIYGINPYIDDKRLKRTLKGTEKDPLTMRIWKTSASARGPVGGSKSRGGQLAKAIAETYNDKQPKPLRILGERDD